MASDLGADAYIICVNSIPLWDKAGVASLGTSMIMFVVESSVVRLPLAPKPSLEMRTIHSSFPFDVDQSSGRSDVDLSTATH